MGEAASRVASTTIGVVDGIAVGAYMGGKAGARIPVGDAASLLPQIVWKKLFRTGEAPDPKCAEVEKVPIYFAEDDIVISASLSRFVYKLDGRLFEIKESTPCWKSKEDMENSQTEHTRFEVGTDKLLIFSIGTSTVTDDTGTKKKFVELEWGSQPLFCWLGTNKIVGCYKTEADSEVKNHFRTEKMAGWRNRFVRAMFGSGGALSPPYVSVILRGSDHDPESRCTLFVAWQGTMVGQRPLDIFTDLGAAPVKAGLWNDTFPDLWVHSAMYAKVQHDALGQKECVLQLIQTHGVRRIVFCGHSLGGGLARVAHVATLGIFSQLTESEKAIVQHVDVKSITWAAPMVLFQAEQPERRLFVCEPNPIPITFDDFRWMMQRDAKIAGRSFDVQKDVEPKWDSMNVSADANDRLTMLKHELNASSVNHIFDKDIFPQLPGNQSFFKPALRMAARSVVKKHSPALVEPLSNLADKLASEAFEGDGLAGNLDELENFSHMCKVVCHSISGIGTKEQTLEQKVAWSTKELPEWKLADDDSYEYLLTCHRVLPHQVMLDPEHDKSGYPQ